MPVLNAFYGNKKIAIVGDSQTAKDIEEALKAENFKKRDFLLKLHLPTLHITAFQKKNLCILCLLRKQHSAK